MDLELRGKKVVVSAGTREVGYAIVEALLDEGAIVSFCARRARKGDANPSNSQVYANPMDGDGVEEALEALSAHGTVCGSVDYMKEGIRANCVCPGPAFVPDGSWGFLETATPDYYQANLDRHPAGRFGTPAEVANAVLFLASSKASWITAANLKVDRGFTRNVKY
jgi:NAD(P)-dependent dehydrogenase (short-subunit alcohol dehydrogenase family)